MAHNSYPAGRSGSAAQWPDGSTVTPDEFAWLAACAFGSINGDNGGTWAPAAVITIGGAGVSFTVSTTFDSFTCTGHASIGSIGVSGFVGVTGNLSVDGDVTFAGGSSGTHVDFLIGPYVDSTINGSLDANGVATFNGNVALSGTGPRSFQIGADYTSTIRGAVSIYGFNVPAGNLIQSDSEARFTAGIRQPIETFTASGNITSGDRYVIGNIGAGGGYVRLPASHPIDAPIEIFNTSSDALDVQEPGGSVICNLAGTAGSAPTLIRAWLLVYYNGSSWVMLKWDNRLA